MRSTLDTRSAPDSTAAPASARASAPLARAESGGADPFGIAFALFVVAALFVLRLLAPSDLMDNDQERPAAYMMDALAGNWIVQRDQSGAIASKPPVYTWLAAGGALALGPSLFSLYLPCAAATAGIALVLLHAGRARFGEAAGRWGAACFLLSMTGAKMVALARTDTLFGALVFAAAMAGFRATELDPGRARGGRAWLPFWSWCAAATLTKGPLGIALAGGGLVVSSLWSRYDARRMARGMEGPAEVRSDAGGAGLVRALRRHAPGVLLLLAISLGWLALATSAEGRAVIDRMIGRELIGHAAAGDAGEPPLVNFYKPPLYFLSRFAPWSLLAIAGVFTAIRRPASDPRERAFERFLVGHLGVGIGLFAVAPHQRPDHLFPLLPAAALLAGREAARLFEWAGRRLGKPSGERSGEDVPARVREGAERPILVWIGAIFLAVATVNLFAIRPRDRAVLRTSEARRLATAIEAAAADAVGPRIDPSRIEFCDAPFALQFFLGVFRTEISRDDAARLLASGPGENSPSGACVATSRPEKLLARLPEGTALEAFAGEGWMPWPPSSGREDAESRKDDFDLRILRGRTPSKLRP